jgi:hypothetical protein
MALEILLNERCLLPVYPGHEIVAGEQKYSPELSKKPHLPT